MTSKKSEYMHGWEKPTFRGYQSLDIYENQNTDIVIRMESGSNYEQDQIVIIPRQIAEAVALRITALSQYEDVDNG